MSEIISKQKRGPGRPPNPKPEAAPTMRIERIMFGELVSYGNGVFDSSGFAPGPLHGSAEVVEGGVMLTVKRAKANTKLFVPFSSIRGILYAVTPSES